MKKRELLCKNKAATLFATAEGNIILADELSQGTGGLKVPYEQELNRILGENK